MLLLWVRIQTHEAETRRVSALIVCRACLFLHPETPWVGGDVFSSFVNYWKWISTPHSACLRLKTRWQHTAAVFPKYLPAKFSLTSWFFILCFADCSDPLWPQTFWETLCWSSESVSQSTLALPPLSSTPAIGWKIFLHTKHRHVNTSGDDTERPESTDKVRNHVYM